MLETARTLPARDRADNLHALARRMGIQGPIFDCCAWFAGVEGIDRHGDCCQRDGKLRHHLDPTQAHRDHIHIEMSRQGARKRTTFWKGRGAP